MTVNDKTTFEDVQEMLNRARAMVAEPGESPMLMDRSGSAQDGRVQIKIDQRGDVSVYIEPTLVGLNGDLRTIRRDVGEAVSELMKPNPEMSEIAEGLVHDLEGFSSRYLAEMRETARAQVDEIEAYAQDVKRRISRMSQFG